MTCFRSGSVTLLKVWFGNNKQVNGTSKPWQGHSQSAVVLSSIFDNDLLARQLLIFLESNEYDITGINNNLDAD